MGEPEIKADASGEASNYSLEGISSGVRFIGRLVAAASIINLLSHATTIPISHWLESALSAYSAVFYPIVDATIGQLPRLFGYALLPITKDVFIVYGIFCGSFFRAVSWPSTEATDGDEKTLFDRIFASLFSAVTWPFWILLFLLFSAMERIFVADDGLVGYSAVTRSLLTSFGKELVIVLSAVVIAIIFNAAGVL